MNNTLKERVITSGAWLVSGHFISQIFRLVSNLILTRLLVPEMFGVMALVSVFMMGLALFTDVGLQQNVTQSNKGENKDYLNTAWSIQILRGIVIFFIALFISFFLYVLGQNDFLGEATVYSDPALPFLLAFMSVTALISGFNSTNLLLLNRKILIGKITVIDLVSQMIGIAVTVLAAWMYREVWALVFGTIIGSAVKMILSHHKSLGDKQRIGWDTESVIEIFHFGKWIFLTSILGFLSMNADRLLLAGLVDSATLGFYAIAFFIVGAFQQIISKLISSVALPAFSEVYRENSNKLKQTYYKFRLIIDVSTLLLMGLLYSTGHLIVQLLYDDRYLSSGYMLEILALSLFTLRFSLAGECFIAIGKPKLLVPVIFIRIMVLFTLIPIAFELWGLEGALWIIAGSDIFPLPLTIYYKIKYKIFSFSREIMVLPVILIGYGIGIIINNAAISLG